MSDEGSYCMVVIEIVETLFAAADAPSARRLVEASVHLPKRGRCWVATCRDGSGRQFWRSTGQTDWQAALTVAQEWEKAARQHRLYRVIRYRRAVGEGMWANSPKGKPRY